MKLFYQIQISVIALSFIKCEDGVNALETPIRASHLKPRHYNPHPYQQYQPSGPNGEYVSVQSFHTDQHTTINDGDLSGYSLLSLSPTPATAAAPSPTPGNGIYSQGPVQFPPSERPNNYNLVGLPHPYVTLKSKGQIINRNNGQLENDLSTQKHYAFSYTVRDSLSGDDFSHSQQQKNGAVEGTYKVQLPDGRTQIVKYIADNDGYRADVSYVEDGTAPVPHQRHPQATQPVDAYSQAVNLNAYQEPPSQLIYASSRQSNVLNAAALPPAPPAQPNSQSTVFLSTPRPYFDQSGANRLSVFATTPTYIVSPKLTQIHTNNNNAYFDDYEDYNDAAKVQQNVYYKTTE